MILFLLFIIQLIDISSFQITTTTSSSLKTKKWTNYKVDDVVHLSLLRTQKINYNKQIINTKLHSISTSSKETPPPPPTTTTTTTTTNPKKKKTTTASLFNNDIARTLQRLTSPFPSSSSSYNSPPNQQQQQQQQPHVKQQLSAAKKAEEMLYHMHKLYTQYNRYNAKPNGDTYKLVMNAYLKLGGFTWLEENDDDDDEGKGGSKRWICIVDELEELYHHYYASLLPDEEDEAAAEERMDIVNCLLQGYTVCAHLHRNKPLSTQISPLSSSSSFQDVKEKTKYEKRQNELTFAERSELTLHNMLLHHHRQKEGQIKPTSKSFKYVIQAYTRQQPFSDKVTRRTKKNWNNQQNPTEVVADAKCLDRAMNILTSWTYIAQQQKTTTTTMSKEECLDLSSSHYKLIQAYSKMNIEKYTKVADELLEQMEKIHDEFYDDDDGVQWHDENEKISDDDDDDDVVDDDDKVIPFMNDNESSEENTYQIYPNSESYTLVLLSYNKISQQQQRRQQQQQQQKRRQEEKIAIAKRAQYILQKMMTRYTSYTNVQKKMFGEPKIIAFNNVMMCWSNCIMDGENNVNIQRMNERCAKEAKDILDWMNELLSGKSASSFAAKEERNDIEKEGEKMIFLTPNVVSYNTVLQAHAKLIPNHGYYYYNEDESDENHAMWNVQYIKAEMDKNQISPDDYTYNILLHAWSKCNAEKAEEILMEMEKRYVTSFLQNEQTNDNKEETGARKRRFKKNMTRKSSKVNAPSVRHYSAVISAWAKFTEDDDDTNVGMERALSLLNQMGNDNYPLVQSGDNTSKIGEKQYSASNDRDNDTSICFRRPKPDLITYSIIMDVLADNDDVPNAGKIAIDLLDKIEAEGNDNVSPRQNRRQHQEDVLTERIYVSAIKAVANEKQADGPQRAWDVLQRLIRKRRDLSSSFGHNHVINSAAISNAKTSSDKTLHFQIALRAFQELRKGKNRRRDSDSSTASTPTPDSFTYAYFIKACCNLLPPSKSRSEIIFKALEECIDDGYLSEEVWRRLMDGVSKEELKDILVSLLPPSVVKEQQAMLDMLYLGDLRVMDLPRQWSCNVESSGKNRRGGAEWSFNF